MRGSRSWARWRIALVLALASACGGAPGEATGEGSQTEGASPSEGGATSEDTATSGVAALGEACDADTPCAPGSYCDTTGVGDTPYCEFVGVCVATPSECSDDDAPICGCDGLLYPNACAAAQAGVGTRGADGCAPPRGRFRCGFGFCELAGEYCEFVYPHGINASWRCLPLVCEGDASPCECTAKPTPCGDPGLYHSEHCEIDQDGGTQVTCLPF
ncbi:MAG: hypothetical protein R3B09_13815 [Nannocystaceae bacterium]